MHFTYLIRKLLKENKPKVYCVCFFLKNNLIKTKPDKMFLRRKIYFTTFYVVCCKLNVVAQNIIYF
jgi:hypothetical protein